MTGEFFNRESGEGLDIMEFCLCKSPVFGQHHFVLTEKRIERIYSDLFFEVLVLRSDRGIPER